MSKKVVARMTTKAGGALFLGTHYSYGACYGVTREVAEAAEEDGRFIVTWLEEKEPAPPAEEPAAAEPETPTEEALPTGTDAEQTAADTPAEDKAPRSPQELEKALKTYDELKTKDTAKWLEKVSDPEILEYLAKHAKWKTSKKNAKERLKEVKG